MGELRGVLGELERRLAVAPVALSPANAAAVSLALDQLARRIARNESAAEGRSRELGAAIGSLTQYLEMQVGAQAAREDQLTARLDRLLVELEMLRTERLQRRAWRPRVVRTVLAVAGGAAALSLVAAGAAMMARPDPMQALAESASST